MTANTTYADADGHVIESIGDIDEFLPGKFVSGRGLPIPDLDRWHISRGVAEEKASPRRGRPVHANEWLQFLDKTGLQWTVLYPTFALAVGRIHYVDWAVDYCSAYNSWLYEKFTKDNPQLHGAGLIPLQDVPSAVQELRRIATELHMPAAMLPSNGLPLHLSHKSYWPVYEEAEKLDIALSVHGGNYENLGFNTFATNPVARSLGMPVPQMVALTGMMVDGVFDAFPKLRIAFLEAGAGWVTLVIDRLRREQEYGGVELKKDPQDYFKEGRLFVGCEGNEEALAYAIQRIGYESVLFASDFPHEISMENCMEEIDEILEREDIPEQYKAEILGGNARRFYKLD